jgi:hypothetical protein
MSDNCWRLVGVLCAGGGCGNIFCSKELGAYACAVQTDAGLRKLFWLEDQPSKRFSSVEELVAFIEANKQRGPAAQADPVVSVEAMVSALACMIDAAGEKKAGTAGAGRN